jgi:hypothetical protein
MLCTDSVSTAAIRTARLPVRTLIVLAFLMTAYLLQLRSVSDWRALSAAGLALGVPLAYPACSRRIDAQIKDCCRIVILGYVGMLAGLIFDAGGTGFIQLLTICRTGHSAGLGTALDSVSTMPAAYLGMAVGCQCGRRLPALRGRAARSCYAQLLAMNGWMLLGMSLGHWAAASVAANLPIRAFGGFVLFSMLAGMAASGALIHWTGGIQRGTRGDYYEGLQEPQLD